MIKQLVRWPSIVGRPSFVRSQCRHVSLQAEGSSDGPRRLSLFAEAMDLKGSWLIHPDLKDHIRASYGFAADSDEAVAQRDTGMSICFLGTGAGIPSLQRGNAATCVKMGSTTYLFDAGEGFQRQLMLSNLKVGDIKKIFALQQCLKDLSEKSEQLVQIYGPPGLYNFIACSLSLTSSELKYIQVEVYELEGGQTSWRHPGSSIHYPEFRHRGLRRQSIPRNSDGTWILEQATEIDSPEKALEWASRPRGMYVRAAQVMHVPKLQCFGYVLEEPRTQPRRIDLTKAQALGVAPGPSYKLLKAGFPCISDDGQREVSPDDVLMDARLHPRKVAIIGDCSKIPAPMAQLCLDADILVHEATLADGGSVHQQEFGGHSTSAMAGEFARSVRAKVLMMNHLPARLAGADLLSVVAEAERHAHTKTKVQLCYDFMEILVPRIGF